MITLGEPNPISTDTWHRVEVTQRGETIEIKQANYDQTGCFVQVVGRALLDGLISDLQKAREAMR